MTKIAFGWYVLRGLSNCRWILFVGLAVAVSPAACSAADVEGGKRYVIIHADDAGMCHSVGAGRAEWVLDRIATLAVGGGIDEIDAGIAAVDLELENVRAEWKRGVAQAAGDAAPAGEERAA